MCGVQLYFFSFKRKHCLDFHTLVKFPQAVVMQMSVGGEVMSVGDDVR